MATPKRDSFFVSAAPRGTASRGRATSGGHRAATVPTRRRLLRRRPRAGRLRSRWRSWPKNAGAVASAATNGRRMPARTPSRRSPQIAASPAAPTAKQLRTTTFDGKPSTSWSGSACSDGKSSGYSRWRREYADEAKTSGSAAPSDAMARDFMPHRPAVVFGERLHVEHSGRETLRLPRGQAAQRPRSAVEPRARAACLLRGIACVATHTPCAAEARPDGQDHQPGDAEAQAEGCERGADDPGPGHPRKRCDGRVAAGGRGASMRVRPPRGRPARRASARRSRRSPQSCSRPCPRDADVLADRDTALAGCGHAVVDDDVRVGGIAHLNRG